MEHGLTYVPIHLSTQRKSDDESSEEDTESVHDSANNNDGITEVNTDPTTVHTNDQ